LISAFSRQGPERFVEELLQPTSATGTTFRFAKAPCCPHRRRKSHGDPEHQFGLPARPAIRIFVVIRTRTGRTDLA